MGYAPRVKGTLHLHPNGRASFGLVLTNFLTRLPKINPSARQQSECGKYSKTDLKQK